MPSELVGGSEEEDSSPPVLDPSEELLCVEEVSDEDCSEETGACEEEGLDELVVDDDEGLEELGADDVVVLEEPADELSCELSVSELSSPDEVSDESSELSVVVLELSSVDGGVTV